MAKRIYPNTDEWTLAKLSRFSASEMHKLMISSKTGGMFGDAAITYIYKKVAETICGRANNKFAAKATEHGNYYENEALEYYENKIGVKLSKTYLHFYDDMHVATPDALVKKDGIVQVKCPYDYTNFIKYCRVVDEKSFLKYVGKEYWYQIHDELLVSGRKWCDFVVYCPDCHNPKLRMHIFRIEKNLEIEAEILMRVKEAKKIYSDIVEEVYKNLTK